MTVFRPRQFPFASEKWFEGIVGRKGKTTTYLKISARAIPTIGDIGSPKGVAQLHTVWFVFQKTFITGTATDVTIFSRSDRSKEAEGYKGDDDVHGEEFKDWPV